jgi:DNA-binding CsgD family transcriptional regulator
VKVRGTTILTRKAIITRRFGAEAWAGFFRDITASHHEFSTPVTATSLVPLPAYLAFHDELVRRFFHGAETAHAELGRESARWALTEGPYRSFMKKRAIKQLVASFPKLWKLYFAETTSHSEAALTGNTIDFKVLGLPQRHPYLEIFVMGYMREMLELYCANPIAAARVGSGGRDYHSLLSTAPLAGDEQGGEEPMPEHSLSDREMEVLRLVAFGKTNDEIGLVLGISGKTVKHHVAHAYGKLGVSGRVGAAMWLAERGLVGR